MYLCVCVCVCVCVCACVHVCEHALSCLSLSLITAETLLGLGEDDCRIYIQQMGQGNMDEDVFISELHITMNDLLKAGLAVPKCEVVSVRAWVWPCRCGRVGVTSWVCQVGVASWVSGRV